MGFGLLFSGYATLLAFRAIPIEVLGYFLTYLGAEKLARHDKKFNLVKYASVYMFFESVLWAALWLLKVTKMPLGFLTTQTFADIENLLYYSGLAVFHAVLYLAVISISKTVGYDKGASRAKFAFVAMLIFFVSQLVVAFVPGMTAAVALPVLVYQMLWLFVNLFLLYGCYAMIVTDEMLEKEERKYNEYMEKHRPKAKSSKATDKNINKTCGRKTYRASKK